MNGGRTRSATTELCQLLIQNASVTPDESECQSILSQRLSAVGFTVEAMRFGEVNNLWARIGDQAPLFVFAGHTDVVPIGARSYWSYPPFSAAIVGDRLYGRGAADMKGSLAAMITAVERYLARYITAGSIAFLITGDEEGPALDGTARVIDTLEARDDKIDWCIVGEPTSTSELGDIIKNGRRGSLSGELRIKGKQGHVAYPHLADNPVHRSLAALVELTQIKWDNGNEFFPATTFQISNINAGTGAGNVIPGELVIMFNLRFGTELSVEHIKQRITDLLDQQALDFSLNWSLSGNPFVTEPGCLTTATISAIEEVTRVRAILDTGGGTSDGRFIAPTGAQVIELGPCNASIHQIDEHVSIAELDSLSAVYEQILCRLLGDTKK